MNQTVSRVLWILAGVLLIIAGVICLINPGAAWTTLSLYLGISMLLSGVIDIVIFARGNRYMAGAGWFLLDGILTVLLSLFLLFHQAFTMLTLPLIFGMWLLYSGASKFVNSFELSRLRAPGWGWSLCGTTPPAEATLWPSWSRPSARIFRWGRSSWRWTSAS